MHVRTDVVQETQGHAHVNTNAATLTHHLHKDTPTPTRTLDQTEDRDTAQDAIMSQYSKVPECPAPHWGRSARWGLGGQLLASLAVFAFGELLGFNAVWRGQGRELRNDCIARMYIRVSVHMCK